MAAARTRQAIASPDLTSVSGLRPLAGVSSILGVRVFDVGQGDSIAVLTDVAGSTEVALQLDYGGRERNPFTNVADVDAQMPVTKGGLLMLTHWDEDHWSSAPKGSEAKDAKWIVPRQITSPRAVRFSASLNDIHCIPEQYVGQTIRFSAANGDYVVAEKIGAFPGAFAKNEDCNKSGIAMAIVHKTSTGNEVILLPGDAPFDKVVPFVRLEQQGVKRKHPA